MYIGIDIGGTKCAVMLAEVSGDNINFVKKEKLKTDNNEPALSVIEKFCSIIDEFKKDVIIDAIGISCGGPLDSKKGIIMRPPNLPTWDDIHTELP